MKKNNYNQSLDWWTHGLKTYFYHFKSFFKIFNILNKDWKTIFEIIIKYHASFEFQKQKQLSAFVKSKFEWVKRNKITLNYYQDTIPRSSTMSEELGLEVWKRKTYLGSRAWTTTWTPKVDAIARSSTMSENCMLEVWKIRRRTLNQAIGHPRERRK